MTFFPKALASVALGFYFIHIFTAALPGEAQPTAKPRSGLAVGWSDLLGIQCLNELFQ